MNADFRKARFWKDADGTVPAEVGDTVALVTFDGEATDINNVAPNGISVEMVGEVIRLVKQDEE